MLEGTLAVDCRSLGNDGERDAFIGSVVARLGWHLHLLDEAVKGAPDDVQKFVAVVNLGRKLGTRLCLNERHEDILALGPSQINLGQGCALDRLRLSMQAMHARSAEDDSNRQRKR